MDAKSLKFAIDPQTVMRRKERLMRRMTFLWLAVLIGLLLCTVAISLQPAGFCANDNVWYVHDVVDPSLDEVKWLEEGAIAEAPAWISDGLWFKASIRQSLVTANDIFVSTYELFNWSRVSATLDLRFGSFYDFAENVTVTPGMVACSLMGH